jgi:hypothetical protein
MFKLNADIPFRYEWYIFGIINFLNGSEIKICSLLCKLVRQKIIFFPIAEGGAKIFAVFRVKNHDFTPKNHIFSNFRGARAGCAPTIMDLRGLEGGYGV